MFGRAPKTPAKLGKADWIAVFKRSFSQFLEDDCLGLSQEVAYSSLLALFPALAGLIGFLGVFHLYGPVLNALEGTVPHSVVKFVRSIRADNHGGAKTVAFVVGLIAALWAASGATSAVIKAVNRAYDRQESRPFWKVRVIAVILVVLTGFALFAPGATRGFGVFAGAGVRMGIVWRLAADHLRRSIHRNAVTVAALRPIPSFLPSTRAR